MTIGAGVAPRPGCHPRLTVVPVAGAPSDARQVAVGLAPTGPIDAVALDAAARRRSAAGRELRARAIEAAIAELALERDAAADLRHAAHAAVDQLERRRAQLIAGARWCEEEGSSVPSLAAGLHAAEERLVGAREQAARAIARLEHVREQQAAAGAALEEARAQLAELDSARLAEPTLRRALEQAVRELQDAERAMAGSRERRAAAEAALGALPAPDAIDVAERRLAESERALVDARAQAQVRWEPPSWWQALGEVHSRVVDAEAKASGRSRASRQHYEATRAEERALLDDLGFDTYLDALLSGGRRPGDAGPAADVAAAETAVTRARELLDAARERTLEADPATERARMGSEVAQATEDLARLEVAAATARRAVARLEGELQARVHRDDSDPVVRAASAGALRDRIATLEQQLNQAATRAEADVAEASASAGAATAERDRTRSALLDIARRAAALADEIAPERRPAFDTFANVGALGGALRAEVALVEAEIVANRARLARAAQAVADADAAIETRRGADETEPTLDDAMTALDELLALGAPGALRVVVEPLVAGAPLAAPQLLDTILRASRDQPVLLVTTDHETIAWAIELPAAEGAVVPLRALAPDDRLRVPR